jgi:hypothetical protein
MLVHQALISISVRITVIWIECALANPSNACYNKQYACEQQSAVACMEGIALCRAPTDIRHAACHLIQAE